jgi:uncharacterized Rossmann fold enzyme
VEYSEWAPIYERIRREFGFAWEREHAAAERLRELLALPDGFEALRPLGQLLAHRDAVVVGLAPRSGPPPLWRLPPTPRPPAILAADGATVRCLSAGLVPDVVVTDLDGPVPAEVEANARGAFVIVHAHGDNREAVEEWVPQFGGPRCGSWAGEGFGGLLDVGGFTDGDRAACLAAHAGARRILLWGFDFADPLETAPPERARKLAKLRWASEILETLARGPVPVLTWRSDGSEVPYEVTGPSTQ